MIRHIRDFLTGRRAASAKITAAQNRIASTVNGEGSHIEAVTQAELQTITRLAQLAVKRAASLNATGALSGSRERQVDVVVVGLNETIEKLGTV